MTIAREDWEIPPFSYNIEVESDYAMWSPKPPGQSPDSKYDDPAWGEDHPCVVVASLSDPEEYFLFKIPDEIDEFIARLGKARAWLIRARFSAKTSSAPT